MQKPSIGRIVHVMWHGETVPAIVTRVHSDGITIDAVLFGALDNPALLTVLPAQIVEKLAFNTHESEYGHGTWWWPPRV